MGMSKFFEAYPHDFGLLCIEKVGTEFGFRCGGSNKLEDCAGDVDSTVVSHLDIHCTNVLMYRTMVLLARPTKVRR